MKFSSYLSALMFLSVLHHLVNTTVVFVCFSHPPAPLKLWIKFLKWWSLFILEKLYIHTQSGSGRKDSPFSSSCSIPFHPPLILSSMGWSFRKRRIIGFQSWKGPKRLLGYNLQCPLELGSGCSGLAKDCVVLENTSPVQRR